MVNYMLIITAELENLTDLQPQDGCDDVNFAYYFKLKCGNCGEVTQKETCVSLNEKVSSTKGKGETHLAQKCKFCTREGTVTMINGRGRPLTQADAENGKSAPLMLFDCRGYEPLDFVFGSGWKVESEFYRGDSFYMPLAHMAYDSLVYQGPINCISLTADWGKEPTNIYVEIEGTAFTDVDLSGGEFVEYDEKGECPVMISNLRAEFTVVK